MRIHFAGGGLTTEYIAKRLTREGHDLVIVEKDERRCTHLQETLYARIVHGDIAHIALWQDADLASTELFIAGTHSDPGNVSACLIAHHFAPQAPKLVRIRSSDYRDWEQIFADLNVRIDRIIHPEADIVARVLRVLHMPGVADVRNFLDDRAKVFSMNVPQGHAFAGLRMDEFRQLPVAWHSRICLILKGTEAIVPRDEQLIGVDDHIYVATPTEELGRTLDEFGINRRQRLHRVFIVGGGEIGLELARALEQEKVHVKLFEIDPQRADILADALPGTLVLNQNGIDQEILLREEIAGADAFVALTGDDDDNLIACLLARRLGVEKVVPLLNRLNFLPLAQRLGINTTVSPRVKSADVLLEYIRRGAVHSVRTLGEEKAEALELVVPERAFFVDQPLGQVRFPAGVCLAFVDDGNGRPRIPAEDDIVRAGDRVVLFALETAVRAFEDAITPTTLFRRRFG